LAISSKLRLSDRHTQRSISDKRRTTGQHQGRGAVFYLNKPKNLTYLDYLKIIWSVITISHTLPIFTEKQFRHNSKKIRLVAELLFQYFRHKYQKIGVMAKFFNDFLLVRR
jgi:hypothetical protein